MCVRVCVCTCMPCVYLCAHMYAMLYLCLCVCVCMCMPCVYTCTLCVHIYAMCMHLYATLCVCTCMPCMYLCVSVCVCPHEGHVCARVCCVCVCPCTPSNARSNPIPALTPFQGSLCGGTSLQPCCSIVHAPPRVGAPASRITEGQWG